MTPLETLQRAANKHTGMLYADEAHDALVAAGHLPAPDVTIQVTLTPEQADAHSNEWADVGSTNNDAYLEAQVIFRDAILEARGAQ